MAKNKVGFGWGYLLIGLLLTIVGVAFMAFSNVLITLAVIIGVALIAFGVVYIAIAFSRQNRDFGFAVKLIVAIMCITAGIITIILRESAVLIMADIFCLLLIVDGAFKFQTAALSKRYKAFGWWFMLVLSVITIASAFIVSKIKTPDTEPGIITVIIGIIIIVDGIANFFTAFYEAYCERKRLTEYEKPEDGLTPVETTEEPITETPDEVVEVPVEEDTDTEATDVEEADAIETDVEQTEREDDVTVNETSSDEEVVDEAPHEEETAPTETDDEAVVEDQLTEDAPEDESPIENPDGEV